MNNFSEKANFLWGIANLIRDAFKRGKYQDVILPFTVLRRIDCVLGPTKQKVLERNAQLKKKGLENRGPQLCNASGYAFYNTSLYDFERLLADAPHLATNLRNYMSGFSDNMKEVLDRFEFNNTIAKLDEHGLLFLVMERFKNIDLHPDKVSNHEMGLIFEELIRRFNEALDENPGEHFTPREVIRLMVNLLLSQDREALKKNHIIRTVYDPCCGSGGMLTIAKERILEINPKADVYLFGQEVNPETWAVSKSDMLMTSPDGRDAENIAFGSTFSKDKHANMTFDYLLANPPYGKDWKMDEETIRAEHDKGSSGRFGAGLPRIDDGQLLFLQHMLSRMKQLNDGGSRVGIVMNGSPLFTGDAGRGESEIRRWILEKDWLDAVIALPEQLFYNTGIATYVWVLTNRKQPKRKGKVQLINATSFWVPMRKSLGDKRREISAEQIQEITKVYEAFVEGEHSKIFKTTDFGYRKITVERPLKLNFHASPERISGLKEESAFKNLAMSKKKSPKEKAAEETEGRKFQEKILAVLNKLPKTLLKDRPSFERELDKAFKMAVVKIPPPVRKSILSALSERDETAETCRDKDGHPEPDSELRDTENVPLGEDINAYFDREVKPHVPDLPAPRPKAGENCIYVLKCADDSFYIGQTDDFDRRLGEHRAQQVSWTAPRLPVEPIHWEVCDTREQAVQREKKLKTGFGRQWLKQEYTAGRLAAASRQAGAWINTAIRDQKDNEVGKVGYEINFNRYFYKYQPPRPLEEIEAEIKGVEKDILEMLRQVAE